MIDFVRVRFNYKNEVEDYITTEGNFDEVTMGYELHSETTKYPMRTKFVNMDLVVTEHTGYMKNSLHKFHNCKTEGNDHNHNDFSFENLQKVINELTQKLPFLEDSRITQLEFGFNIETEIPAEEIIKNSLFLYRGKLYNHNKQFRGAGEYLQFDSTNYCIKIYDKAKHYKVKGKNILRIEIKYVEKSELTRLKITKLTDLLDKSKLQVLFNDFIKKIDEMIIIDSYDSIDILPKDKEKITRYSNPKYWTNLSNRRMTKSNHKTDFKRLLTKYSLNTVEQFIKDSVNKKFQYLINN
jgi:hypothetical protein